MITIAYTGTNGNGCSYNQGSQQFDTTKEEIIADGTFTLSGNYGTSSSHGDPVDFTAASLNGITLSVYAPTFVQVYEAPQAGAVAKGYLYVYCPGPNIATQNGCTPQGGVLQILGTGTASQDGGNEITEAAAYSAQSPSLDGAVLRFRAWFTRLL